MGSDSCSLAQSLMPVESARDILWRYINSRLHCVDVAVATHFPKQAYCQISPEHGVSLLAGASIPTYVNDA